MLCPGCLAWKHWQLKFHKQTLLTITKATTATSLCSNIINNSHLWAARVISTIHSSLFQQRYLPLGRLTRKMKVLQSRLSVEQDYHRSCRSKIETVNPIRVEFFYLSNLAAWWLIIKACRCNQLLKASNSSEISPRILFPVTICKQKTSQSVKQDRQIYLARLPRASTLIDPRQLVWGSSKRVVQSNPLLLIVSHISWLWVVVSNSRTTTIITKYWHTS